MLVGWHASSSWWQKKLRGHSGKKNAQKSRNSCRMNGRSCGYIGTVDSRPKCAHSWNQIQTLKEYLSCHMYCAQVWAHLGVIVIASCAVSNRESRYPPSVCAWLGDLKKNTAAPWPILTNLVQTRLKIGSQHCTAAFCLQVPKWYTDLDLTILYILISGTYGKFVQKNKMLVLGVCSFVCLFICLLE